MDDRADVAGGDPSALRYTTAPERRQSILDAVDSSGFVSVTELASRLGVSDMTVRRDLRKLARNGLVRMVHGGASAVRSALHPPEFTGRAEEYAQSKQAIGEAVVADLDPRAVVAVDAGTTTYAAVQALPLDFLGTVVTHSIPVMQLALARGLGSVVGLGGELLHSSQAFIGPRTVEATKGLRVDTLLLGAAAVDTHGVYVFTDIERPTKLALMGIARRTLLLIDSSKFETSAPVLLCDWDAITGVVTDAEPTPDLARRLTALPDGIRVVGG
jgi:DeoR/GlpR family transcriptional regulator of sugar metabolism